jgi:choline dehydrogenase-like flavoprotein
VDGSTGPDREASVEYVDRTTRERRTVRCRAVVVAAGALDSTKLLLQSRTDDFPDGLGNSGGLVGRYLHDHARQWWPAQLERPMPILAHPIYIAREAVGEGDPLMAASMTMGMVGAKARIMSWYGGRADRVGVQVLGTMVPSEEFTVRLLDRRPADDPADDAVEVCIRYDDQTQKNLGNARDRFVDIFAHAGLAATPQGPFHDIRPGSSFHYGGTIRMHADRAFGVLDEWNRVYDSPNVLVCDASCFPTGPEKNPTLTAMAIAGRAAHRLAADLKDGGLG